ncbi:ABC transporter substrate-binding protein [Pseudaeromonas paramecii]|uniref:ABC transporter substrate binding protein n=1 Tax=Pseudaeromonas paramecii TaxID=2138166 RepID=A0ABP8QFJ5_9GAMM
MTRWLGLLLLWLSSAYCLAAQVLVIHSYHPGHPWIHDYSRGLAVSLPNQQLTHVYLDTKRLPPSQFAAQGDLAWQSYLQRKPDLVILGDDIAIDLLALRIANHGTPVVFLGMNDNPRHGDIYGQPLITGVLERPLMKRNLVEMTQMLGEVRRVKVLFDASSVASTALRDNFGSKRQVTLGRLRVDLVQTNDYQQWKQQVLAAKDKGFRALFVGLYHTLKDESGQPVDAETVLQWSAQHSPVPLFAFWEFSVGPQGAVGGLVIQGYEQGLLAGQLAQQILTGTAPSALPIRIGERASYWFSRSQLKRWQLTPRLRENSHINWRP